jgi:CheY-like chemotaxis protein
MSKPIEILLVEDDPADIRLAREAIKECKIQNRIRVVHDGEDALRYLRREGQYSAVAVPDMVILDMNLPKIDGHEVLAEMKKDPALRDVPSVLVAVSTSDREFLDEFGVLPACLITKPLTCEQFLEAVRCFPQFGLSIVHVAAAD